MNRYWICNYDGVKLGMSFNFKFKENAISMHNLLNKARLTNMEWFSFGKFYVWDSLAREEVST